MRTSKKLLSLFLSAVLCLSLLPTMAWAEEEDDYVAQIGEDKYENMQAAFEACAENANEPTVITLLHDVDSGSSFGFPDTWKNSGRNIVLDLNDCTYTFKDPGMGSAGTESQAMHLINGNKLTVKRGTLTVSKESEEIKRMIQNYCDLTLEDVVVDTSDVPDDFSPYNNSFCRDTVTLKGSTQFIASSDDAVIFDVDGNYCKNNCDVALVIDEIFTGSIGGKVEYVASSTDGHSATVTDHAKYLISYDNNYYGTQKALVAAGAVAKIDNVGYKTLAEAVADAESGDTITLLKSCEGEAIGTFENATGSKIPVKGFTIDFGGHTYTVNSAVGSTCTVSQAFHLEKGAKVTLKNGTISTTTKSGCLMVLQNYCDLTLTDLILDGTNVPSNYVSSNNCGTVLINGSTSIKASDGKVAFDSCGACWNKKPYGDGAVVTVNTTGTIEGDIECCATIVINNGTFTGGITLHGEVGCPKSVTVSGGTFSSDPTTYKAEGKIVRVNDGGTYTVVSNSNLTSGTYLTEPNVASGYCATVSDGKYVVSAISSSGGGGGGSSTTKTETTTNADGSKTTTTTDTKTGAVTETTTKTETAANGTKTETKVEVVTAKDGTVTEKQTETATAKNGTTATKVETTDAAGKTETKVEAKVTAAAVTEAKTADKPVTIPVTVESTKSAETAATVSVSVPKSAGSTKVEVPVTNVTAGTVAVLVKADGTEEIIKTSVLTEDGVALKVEGDVQIKIIDNTKEFTDVVDNHWAGDAIDFATSHEIFNGTGDKSFAPEATMTRAMLFTVLARFDGAPVVTTGENWYADSMEWAKTNGVSDGTNPKASISREQLATMLYRYAGAPAVTADLSAYGDAATVRDYAAAAMQWAVSVGLINGIGGNLEPQGFATRAQLAAIMQRFCTNVAF